MRADLFRSQLMDKKWKDNSLTKTIIQLLKVHESIVFYDLETSGFSAKKDRILQFSAVRCSLPDFNVIDQINIFIKAPFSIPAKITEVNHIDDALLEEKGISQREAMEKIREFLKDDDLIAGYNNNRFDDPFMTALYSSYGYEFQYSESIDVYKYVKTVVPAEAVMVYDEKRKQMVPQYKLATVTTYFDPDNTVRFHDASGDVEATIYAMKETLKVAAKMIEEEEKEEEKRREIPRQNADILSISYFSPSMKIVRVYVNTSQGTFFYDDIKHEWRGKTGNPDSIDMASLTQKVFKLADVTNESDLIKMMRKKRKISA